MANEIYLSSTQPNTVHTTFPRIYGKYLVGRSGYEHLSALSLELPETSELAVIQGAKCRRAANRASVDKESIQIRQHGQKNYALTP
jgi:hypothetical protein